MNKNLCRRFAWPVYLIFLLLSSGSSAQNLDSLYSVWKDPAQADSTRTKAFGDYIRNGFVFSNPDTAYILAEELIKFGKEKEYPKATAAGLNIKGVSFYIKGNYPKALDYYAQSLEITKQLGDQKGVARSLNNIGLLYKEQGDYPKALDYYTHSLKIKEQMADLDGMASSLGNIGLIYNEQGDNTKALDYFTQSLKIYEQMGDQRGMASLLNNIGLIYRDQGDYSKALDNYAQSLAIFEQRGDQGGMAATLNNIGNIYRDQGDYPKALDHYTNSLRKNEQLGDQKGMAVSFNNIGVIYRNQGDNHKALHFCQMGYDLALSIGVLEEQKNACQCLYDSYKELGKGNEALVYLEKMRVVESSLQQDETAKKLQQIDFQKVMLQDSIAKAEEARLMKEAHQKEVRKKDRTKNIFLFSGLAFMVLAGGLYSRISYVRNSKAVLQVEKDRSENLLLNILPAEIAAELKEKGRAEARNFDSVSILFTDFKGFTEQSAKLSAAQLVHEINHCFETFDGIIEKYGIEKIKTIGDAYMAAGGLPVPSDDSVKRTVKAAIEMQALLKSEKQKTKATTNPPSKCAWAYIWAR